MTTSPDQTSPGQTGPDRTTPDQTTQTAQTTDTEPGLAAGTMGGFEVLAQSVAGIAPSAVMATGPALVALGAGGAVMYSYLASTIILLMVGWCITQFAKRDGGSGTLLSYITKALGPGAGFVGSIGLAFGYALIAVASLAGLTLYLEPLLAAIGIPGTTSTVATVIIVVVVTALAAYAMVQGVELSTRIGVVLEIISITAILVVVVAIVSTKGFSVTPLSPPDLSGTGVTGGMVLAILGYVGFESAACMGTEARAANKTVPRAVLGSVLIAGSLYLISAYAQLVGFGTGAALAADTAPLNTLADNAGVHALGYLVDVGAVASFFACVTGSINAASRLLFSMGRKGLLPRRTGAAHPVHKTPYVAITVLATFCALLVVVLSLSGVVPAMIFATMGTIGTYGYMVAYILVTIGVTLYLRQLREPIVTALVIGGLATIGMLYVLFKNVYPIPPAPYNVLPWIFLGVLVVSVVWYAAVRNRADIDTHIAEDHTLH